LTLYPLERKRARRRFSKRTGIASMDSRPRNAAGRLHYKSGMETEARDYAAKNCTVFGGNHPRLEGLGRDQHQPPPRGQVAGRCSKITLIDARHQRRCAAAFPAKVKAHVPAEFLDHLGLVPPATHPEVKRPTTKLATSASPNRFKSNPATYLESVTRLELIPLTETENSAAGRRDYKPHPTEMSDQARRPQSGRTSAAPGPRYCSRETFRLHDADRPDVKPWPRDLLPPPGRLFCGELQRRDHTSYKSLSPTWSLPCVRSAFLCPGRLLAKWKNLVRGGR